MTQVWLFVAPGLYANEKKLAIPFVAMSSFFFVAGAVFSHYIVFPLTWAFFQSFASDKLTFMPRIEPAFGLYVKLMLTFGLIFQMPTLVLFLAKMGVITAQVPDPEHEVRDPDHVHRRRGAVARHRPGRSGADGRPDVPPLL